MIEIKDGGPYGNPYPFNMARVDGNNAIRSSNSPIDWTLSSGGFFRVSGSTGALTGAAANSPIFSFRWTSTTKVAVITTFEWWWTTTTAFGTAQLVSHSLYVARSFSAADTGGTDITPAAGEQKKRSTMADSALTTGSLLVATTGALTAGTRTLDGSGIASRSAWSGAIGAVLLDYEALSFDMVNEYPVVLAANEGLVLNNIVAMGATGVISLGFDIAWAEVDPSVLI